MNRKPYPSDLTDAEWSIFEPLLPPAKPGGHPRTQNMREILTAIFYLVRGRCAWRALPHDLPNWSTVWTYFRNWRLTGVWERMHTSLREAVRTTQGRETTPSAAILDSQSVKTTEQGGERGYDAAKTPLQRLLAAHMLPASVQGTRGTVCGPRVGPVSALFPPTGPATGAHRFHC